jgi:hypothetical protein
MSRYSLAAQDRIAASNRRADKIGAEWARYQVPRHAQVDPAFAPLLDALCPPPAPGSDDVVEPTTPAQPVSGDEE